MKVVYKNETKKLPQIDKLPELIHAVAQAFDAPLVNKNQKFYYNDEDGDTITVSTQGDLKEAIEAMGNKLKLFASKDVAEANQAMSQSMLDRSICLTGRSSMVPKPFIFENPVVEPIQVPKPQVIAKPVPAPVAPVKEVPEPNQVDLKDQLQNLIKEQVAKYCQKKAKKLAKMQLKKMQD